jgi:cyclic-di-AMP phosphodiesterase PgpH
MKLKKKIKKILYGLLLILIGLSVIFSLFYVSLPQKYDLKIGDASPYDINANRILNDIQATEKRANMAAAEVEDVITMDPQIKVQTEQNLIVFFQETRNIRLLYANRELNIGSDNNDEQNTEKPATLQEAAILLYEKIEETLKIQFSLDDCEAFISLEDHLFQSYQGHAISISGIILSEPVSRDAITIQIQTHMLRLSGTIGFISSEIKVLEKILQTFIQPNIFYDQQATESAKLLAYQTVMQNPVMIAKGTRIVNFGDIITEEKYALLDDMGLLDTGEFDYYYFSGILIMITIISSILYIYFRRYETEKIQSVKDMMTIFIAMLIPFVLSLFLVRSSILAPPVYITAVLVTAYFGFRTGLVTSFMLAFIVLPITGFDPKFLMIAILGSVIAALYTLGISKRNNYALIIISTALTCFLASTAYGVLTRISLRELFFDSTYAVGSGAISVIIALGLMPLFEMIFNSVSPLRLVELSQPGNPLLRKLFIEAPGTSQHSMMVGNLAAAGAEAIGANPLLVRVGAYYHDIGKLENPEMFTENQEGMNPHDQLSPEESSAIILAHPDAGLRIARKYKLPNIICKMIQEHHGTSKQVYFYRKALDHAKDNNLPAPNPQNYIYKTSRPTSREAGILMLADTVEAAIKSSGINTVEEAQPFIRKLVRQKIEEEQLVDSKLSFRDVEELIQAFIHIYSGHFRTRVRYPDDPSVAEQTK